MNNFINYLIECYSYLGIFALAYALLQKKLNHAIANRYVILASLALAVSLPLMPFSIAPGAAVTETAVYEVILSPVIVGAAQVNAQMAAAQQGITWLLYAYLLGVFVSLALLLYRFGSTLKLIMRAERSKHKGYTLCEVDEPNEASSFFRWVILSKQCPPEHINWIVQHELAHIRGMHSLDLIFAELMSALYWMHPGAWYFRHVMKENHEYLADAKTLEQSGDKQHYCQVLLAEALGTRRQMLQHPFAGKATLRKRIQRMTCGSGHNTYSRYFILVPVLALAVALHACNEEPVEEPMSPEVEESLIVLDQMIENGSLQFPEGVDPEERIAFMRQAIKSGELNLIASFAPPVTGQKDKDGFYINVDKMPQFKGGEAALMRWLGENIKYPDAAKADEVEGTAFVSFVIDTDGNPFNFKVLNENVIDSRLSKATLEALQEMPAWEAGNHAGENVKVKYNLPVRFALAD